MNILCVKLGSELLQLLLLLFKLCHKVLYRTLQLLTLDAALTQLLAQLRDKRAVLLHGVCDEAYVLAQLTFLVGTLAILHYAHAVLGLVYLAESFLNLVEGLHHIVYLIVLFGNNLLQRIALLRCRLNGGFRFFLAAYNSKQGKTDTKQK